MLRVFDPTHEGKTAGFSPAARLDTLKGITVGFISNGKEGTKGFFTHLDRVLREDAGVADVIWRQKKNYSAPAEQEIVEETRHWQAAVTGIGD